ncbi:FdhF/YdeP family oxidoreductase [Nocardioides sp. YIM 152315]|uniref:FdhF/YdeP family oxidoreductase n=1 Tax=Nocardioides sp. YIM 152315 TaxID=3031760 RepID=UPI0023DCC968|nr:FdhF/YdeP family oxidoreductase [Nocardioides sp. YIM 152315]MDF1605854.1 FdhF/YdeP family oxidoreductase [Nocardioides sp. YIM 152315]
MTTEPPPSQTPADDSQPSPEPQPRLKVEQPAHHAAGVKAVAVAMKQAVSQMGVTRTTRTLSRINQPDGFDCMSCAWPDPDPEHRHSAEFCENGAKAVAEEATKERVGRDFFRAYSIADLSDKSEYWLGKQGRLTEPMVKRSGSQHYEPIAWEDAFTLIATHLTELVTPDEATFYTSGRASNEAAFLYQLFVRMLGTNNLPDCSNMCHESSGVALIDSIGIGKGSVSLLDFYSADLIVVAGQNPGTNHPRMLSALEAAKRRGARILSINPLLEAGTSNFHNPQNMRGMIGKGTDLADLHLPVKVNGDHALFLGIGKLLLEWRAIDADFTDAYTVGLEEWAEHVGRLSWSTLTNACGLSLEEIESAARMVSNSRATIWCWAMGLTQHHNSVATIREVVNLALLRGDLGKAGAGLCPVRGHSNVQGDRTMGVWEKAPGWFLDSLGAEFSFKPSPHHGFDAVESIEAMHDGRVSVFIGLGGNFAHAAPDTGYTTEALRSTKLTVQISTKLNRSHAVCGDTAIILPTLGRTELDMQSTGPQMITVEDSMSVVHASRGRLRPASDSLRSEVAIICGIAAATLGDRHDVDWGALAGDYSLIRRHIASVVPGFEHFEERVLRPGGFVLPHPPRDSRTFETASGRAEFGVSQLATLEVEPGQLVLQTLRSHDQFNTTIYGLNDRYRGIHNGRRVLFMNRADISNLGFKAGDVVDIHAAWRDGRDRCAPAFRLVAYNTPRGSVAAYYPETNPLIPIGSTAEHSNTPTSKSVIVTLSLSSAAPIRDDDRGPALDELDGTGTSGLVWPPASGR